MRIVTDSGADLGMTPEELNDLEIEVVPLTVTLEGKSYREGLDIAPADFYRLLAGTSSLPTTSQPSAGEFAEVYRRIAASDPDILSVHISSGLSGTIGAPCRGGHGARGQHHPRRHQSLSAATGWQVRAAAMAAKAGCTKEQIVATLQRVASASSTLFTLDDLKYLIHGGRISHMKGLIASVLRLKPFIGVDKVTGMYVQMGQARTFQRALRGVVDLMSREHQPGSNLRVQVLHAENPEGAAQLRELIDERFSCSWLPVGPISFVLGAHTGPSLVGVCYASAEALGGAL